MLQVRNPNEPLAFLPFYLPFKIPFFFSIGLY